MSFRKILVGALLCSATVSTQADAQPDLVWRMEGSTTRDASSTVASRNTISELALSSWDVGESATRGIYRYPFKAIIFTIR